MKTIVILFILNKFKKAIKQIKSWTFFQLHGTKKKSQEDVLSYFKTLAPSLSLKKCVSRPTDIKPAEIKRIESLKSIIEEKDTMNFESELHPISYYQIVS